MLASAALLLAGSLPFATDAEIRGEIVRLGDVADVSALPVNLRLAAAVLPLARFDRDAPHASIPRAFLAAQARARMPALTPWLTEVSEEVVRLRRPLRAGVPVVIAGRAEGVIRGERVSIDIDAGVFHITRNAIAMSEAKPGERLFVRTAEGEAISARCMEDGR